MHSFDSAVERALRDWEQTEEVAAEVTLVTASIDIDAPPEEVYDLVLDPARLDEWVTIHRQVNARDDGPPRKG